ncbi:MAG: APC family permease [Clostridiales Family XIII bacterium]|nr:APC family permease [Clostridiales Family XIII bacterium]
MNETTKAGAVQGAAAAGLKKHRMSTATVVFMVFSLVAAGCYGIEDMIPAAGPGLTLAMLMVLPFVWGMPFGLVAAELGSVRPQEGGYYKWVQEALGEFWGFQAGWWRTVSIYIDNALYVILAGGYAATQWDMSAAQAFALKAAMILIFMYINIRGVKDVGLVTNALSVFVIMAFAMIALIGFANWNHNPFDPFLAGSAETAADLVAYVGAGISIGMWMYSGYESMSTVAGELEDPQVIPRATLITVPLIMATYIFPTMASLASMGRWDEWGEDALGYADVAKTMLPGDIGAAAGVFFIIVAIVAQCSIYNTYIASGSRGFFALAEDRLAPPFLVKVDRRYGVPYVAVISIAVVNLILCNFAFEAVVVVDVFLLVASYIMVYISAIILRKRIPREEYKFRIPGSDKVLYVICIVPICVAFISFFINGADYFIGGMLGIITGPILYVIWKKMYGGLAAKPVPAASAGSAPATLARLNPKTGLAQGDMSRMALMFVILGGIGLFGRLFLPWYEGAEAAAYYAEEYAGGLFADWGAMLGAISAATAVCIAAALALRFIAIKVENKNQK